LAVAVAMLLLATTTAKITTLKKTMKMTMTVMQWQHGNAG